VYFFIFIIERKSYDYDIFVGMNLKTSSGIKLGQVGIKGSRLITYFVG